MDSQLSGIASCHGGSSHGPTGPFLYIHHYTRFYAKRKPPIVRERKKIPSKKGRKKSRYGMVAPTSQTLPGNDSHAIIERDMIIRCFCGKGGTYGP
jgi:hypothetical protein